MREPSGAGAAATASWFDSPRQINPSWENASFDCSIPDIDTPASSPARSNVWIEAAVVPRDCASSACASTLENPARIIATPAAAAAATATRTHREKAASRAFAASISRESRSNPRDPASLAPFSSVRTCRPPTAAKQRLTRFSIIAGILELETGLSYAKPIDNLRV
jgi:hypothetical protein